jgi:hypothetical protein
MKKEGQERENVQGLGEKYCRPTKRARDRAMRADASIDEGCCMVEISSMGSPLNPTEKEQIEQR